MRSKALVAFLVLALVAALAPATASAGRGWVDSKLHRMTLEEKVGQLFVANVYGRSAGTTDPDDVAANQAMYGPDIRNARDLVERYKLGSIVYFRWTHNLDQPAQIARLSNGIQRAALAGRPGIPLLISTDQEHGVVSRVWAPATEFPGNMALGATRRPGDAFDAGRVTGTELKALGINQNYAPVADVNINPLNPVIGVRSFGENPDARLRHDRAPPSRVRSARESPRRSSTSPATATPSPTATAACLDLPHARAVGADRRAAVPRRDRRRRRHGHDRARRHARAAERLRSRHPGGLRPGHARRRRSSPACCARSSASAASW